MATLNDYFRNEARDFLRTLESSLARSPAPDATALHRAVRGLRGTAQMARAQRVFEVVSAFESVTRSLAGGALAWSDHVAARARDTIADLRALLDATEDDEQLDARVAATKARWSDGGGAPAPAAARPPTTEEEDRRAFREFTAREAAGISDAIDRGLSDLQADPMDREPLKTILRRQRALLGSARLEEVPVVAEILRAIEDLTRVIAKLDIGVKQEWLDIYRVARDALQTTIAPLLHDKLPEPSHAVSRLRHMRAELLERYGSGEDEAPAHDVLTANSTAVPGSPAVPQPPRAAPPSPQVPGPIAPFMPRGTAPASPAARPFAAPAPAQRAATPPAASSHAAASPAATHAAAVPPALDTAVPPAFESAVPDVVEPPPAEDEVLELGEDSVVVADADADMQEQAVAEDVIEIDALSYTREDALDRALELHDVLARAVAHDPQARDIVEELFDLIRIARSER